MKRSIASFIAIALAGCPASTSTMTGGTSLPPAGGGATGPDASGNITIPNVFSDKIVFAGRAPNAKPAEPATPAKPDPANPASSKGSRA